MTPEYRADKEASVSHLGGSGIWEINFITFIAPASAFVWAVLQTRQSFFKPYTFPAYVVDFLIQCCTILFATTVYAGSPQTLNGLLFLPAVAAYLQPKAVHTSAAKPPVKTDEDSKDDLYDDKDPLPVKPFITSYRAAMMIITCTSILAVDFKVFPRRFAKTESFGTSLMDLGVGSFVFSAGVIAARQQLKEEFSKTKSGLASRMKTAMRHSIPLVVLGLARLATVKRLDYAEHVSEYGVHWNFFFTLALLSPTVALIEPLLRKLPSIGAFVFVLAIAYELLLYMTPGLKHYIILSPRIPGDWLSQNREGVFSFIGYFAIFLGGMGIGQGILPRDDEVAPNALHQMRKKDVLDEDADWLSTVLATSQKDAEGNDVTDGFAEGEGPAPMVNQPAEEPRLSLNLPKLAIIHLVKWTFLWFVCSTWAMWRYGPRLFVSRRMANMPYIFWVCTFNSAQLMLYCFVEMIMFPGLYLSKNAMHEKNLVKETTSRVLAAYNRNGLAIFLLANLLTGAINLAMPTWWMGDVEAVIVLVSYIAVLTGVAFALDHYDISIKL